MKKVIVWILVAVMIVASCGCAAKAPVEVSKAPVPKNALIDAEEARIFSIAGDGVMMEDMNARDFSFKTMSGKHVDEDEKVSFASNFSSDWLFTQRDISTGDSLEKFCAAYNDVLMEVGNSDDPDNPRITTGKELFENADEYMKAIVEYIEIPVYIDGSREYIMLFFFYKFSDEEEWTIDEITFMRFA